jgi:hypothetical protein
MKTILFLFGLAVAGCATARPTQLALPHELASECSSNCTQLDMRMSAVVIIMNSAGCVCEPKTTATPPTAGSATIAGGAAIQAVLQAQRESRSSQQKQSSSSSH